MRNRVAPNDWHHWKGVSEAPWKYKQLEDSAGGGWARAFTLYRREFVEALSFTAEERAAKWKDLLVLKDQHQVRQE